jgi:hypothetical protein
MILHHSCGVGAGNSSRYLNLWDPDTLTFSRICHWLDGESTTPTETAYPHFLYRESDGRIGVFYTWHEWATSSDTDHDLAYTYSDDGGVTWRRQSDGSAHTLPIRYNTGDNNESEIIDAVASGTSFLHGGAGAFDADGYPWFGHVRQDQKRRIIRWDGADWVSKDFPNEFNNVYGLSIATMFFHKDRMYIVTGSRQRGRHDVMLRDITSMADSTTTDLPQEIVLVKGLATGGTATEFDSEAFRRHGVYQRMITHSMSGGDEFGWVQTPAVLYTLPLENIPLLRSGSVGMTPGIEILHRQVSNFGDSWTVSGTGMTLLPGAPRWAAMPWGDLRDTMLVARIFVSASIAAGSTFRIGMLAGYTPAYGAAIDVDIASTYIFSTESWSQTGWNVIPVIPWLGGTLQPFHVACAAAVAGAATGTIDKITLEIGMIPGPRFAAT